MTSTICIHGHFYQPPRENPWTNEIEPQPSAAPFEDWNARIAYECYAPNCAAEILNAKGTVTRRVNTYRYLSFNFGPTLMSWLAKHERTTYDAIRQADAQSLVDRNGHGNAIAQGYHHVILPLSSPLDRRTELRWGIRDFQSRFDRYPESIWLPETAVNTPTLEAMVDEGLKYVILAPEQAQAVRKIGRKAWSKVNHDSIETSRPYRIKLPSGRSIAAFFYRPGPAQGVAFGGWLHDGEGMAKRMAKSATGLYHFATDGESYGHHHRKGEMALAYCVKTLQELPDATMTNYGAYLAQTEVQWEAKIVENSAWSCAHGVGRWSANCGCAIDPSQSGKQQWRHTLRIALNDLRNKIDQFYFESMSRLGRDPWLDRDRYIHDLIAQEGHHAPACEGPVAGLRRTHAEAAAAIEHLLEIQRFRLMMFTSCGWFFDDPAGLETVQILRYAYRAIKLVAQNGGPDFEPDFVDALAPMASVHKDTPSGRDIWTDKIRPTAPVMV
ncbi:MAG: DUF3536 domain-containing protein [Myxococcota bacterium]|nr:DUF3536 domain-containing protein [Myxococcota bacterium]